MKIDNAMNVLNACRGCLSSEIKSLPISERRIRSSFIDFTKLKISSNTRLLLCYKCVHMIKQLNKFRVMCLNSHKILEAYNKNIPKPQNDTQCAKLLNLEQPYTDWHLFRTSTASLDICCPENGALATRIFYIEEEEMIQERLKTEESAAQFDEKLVLTSEYYEAFDDKPNCSSKGNDNLNIINEPSYKEIKIEKPYDVFETGEMVIEEVSRGNNYPNDDQSNVLSTIPECDNALNVKVAGNVSTCSQRKKISSHKSEGNDSQRKNTANSTKKSKNIDDSDKEKFKKNSKTPTGSLNGGECYRCKVCGRSHTNKYPYNRHMKHHLNPYPFSCKMCNRGFREQHQLVVHMCKHTEVLSFTCDVCGKSFASKTNLRAHKIVHVTDKKYECDICNKKFADKTRINSHLRVHFGKKNFICDTCGKAFSAAQNLACHKRIHTGEKPYSCPICYKRFADHSSVKPHIRLHTGQKPYECGECGATFRTLSSLHKHETVHSDLRPFQCDACPFTAKRKYHLTRHKIIHEKNFKFNESTFTKKSEPG